MRGEREKEISSSTTQSSSSSCSSISGGGSNWLVADVGVASVCVDSSGGLVGMVVKDGRPAALSGTALSGAR